jgi:hypothetical protein
VNDCWTEREILITAQEGCKQLKMVSHKDGNLVTKHPISDAIAALPQANVDLCVCGSHHDIIKNCTYIKVYGGMVV